MQIDLSDKQALVTGSTAGICLAIATGLAGAGASVSIIGRYAARVEAVMAASTGPLAVATPAAWWPTPTPHGREQA